MQKSGGRSGRRKAEGGREAPGIRHFTADTESLSQGHGMIFKGKPVRYLTRFICPFRAMKSRPKTKATAAQPPTQTLRGKKTWREKLQDDKDLPKTIPNPYKTEDARSSGTMLIPAPREVDALMRRVPRGKLTTIDELRTKLAAKHKATVTCPITTGIFAWIAAHAADEASSVCEADVTPYWRTLKKGGELNPKYPGGLDAIAARLKAEGHAIFQKGKRSFVHGFEKTLARL
jgi:hypothetical protein